MYRAAYDIVPGLYVNSKLPLTNSAAFFDMEGTICEEFWPSLGALLGPDASQRLTELTNQAMNKGLSFQDAVIARYNYSRKLGANNSHLHTVADNLQVFDGASKVLKGLYSDGYTIFLLTGGFTSVAQKIAEQLPYVFGYVANEIDFENGHKVTFNVTDKAGVADKLTQYFGFQRAIGVGDGNNDIGLAELIPEFFVVPQTSQVLQEKGKYKINTFAEILELI